MTTSPSDTEERAARALFEWVGEEDDYTPECKQRYLAGVRIVARALAGQWIGGYAPRPEPEPAKEVHDDLPF